MKKIAYYSKRSSATLSPCFAATINQIFQFGIFPVFKTETAFFVSIFFFFYFADLKYKVPGVGGVFGLNNTGVFHQNPQGVFFFLY